MNAQDGKSILEVLSKEADFSVRVVGFHIDEFDLGLFQLDTQSQPTKPLRIRREGCFNFFLKQKNKKLVIVRYYAAAIEDWSSEIERTVKYFKDAGFERVVLAETYGMSSGVSIKHDTR
jgi:hypothetical protein